jgi:SH3-like domain-containing protein
LNKKARQYSSYPLKSTHGCNSVRNSLKQLDINIKRTPVQDLQFLCMFHDSGLPAEKREKLLQNLDKVEHICIIIVYYIFVTPY